MEATSSAEIARSWRTSSSRRGLPSTGWRVPAVIDVTSALSRDVIDPAELADAAQAFGSDRSACGFTFEQCLNDVDSLLEVVGQQWCPLLYRYVALGWDRCRSGVGVSLYDPLTMLSSSEFFLMRLRETYRGIDCGLIAADRHVLCVVQLHSTGAFLDLELGLMATSSALHAAFNGPQTISKFGSSSCVVLEVDDDRSPRRVAAAGRLIGHALERSAPCTQVLLRTIDLPPGYAEADELLSALDGNQVGFGAR
ncbi:MAG: hypothetical protein WKF57_03805 [Nakamurella sp.]